MTQPTLNYLLHHFLAVIDLLLKMKYPVTDIISAPISEEVENFRYDYTDPAGQLDENTLTRARYGLTFALSFVLIFLRLYISLFGRRMRNEGLRWHSIFISIFSLIQLVISVPRIFN